MRTEAFQPGMAVRHAEERSGGNLGSFMQALAGSMKLKPTLLVVAITVLPALLAGPAARLGAGLRPDAAPTTPLNG